jgi:hypothetical protein
MAMFGEIKMRNEMKIVIVFAILSVICAGLFFIVLINPTRFSLFSIAQKNDQTDKLIDRIIPSNSIPHNLTTTPTTIVSAKGTPKFYKTISFGSNQSSALTEDPAWKYAEAFFQKVGVQDIQPSEIVPLGQKIWKDKDDHQEMVWGFKVTRLVEGINIGGMITIDAYDGHVVDYSGYQ